MKNNPQNPILEDHPKCGSESLTQITRGIETFEITQSDLKLVAYREALDFLVLLVETKLFELVSNREQKSLTLPTFYQNMLERLAL